MEAMYVLKRSKFFLRRSAWIDDSIEENGMIFVVLITAPDKREKQQNKRVKRNNIW